MEVPIYSSPMTARVLLPTLYVQSSSEGDCYMLLLFNKVLFTVAAAPTNAHWL